CAGWAKATPFSPLTWPCSGSSPNAEHGLPFENCLLGRSVGVLGEPTRCFISGWPMPRRRRFHRRRRLTMRFLLDRYVSPLCPLLLASDDEGALRALDFGDHDSRIRRLLLEQYGDIVIEKGAAPKVILRA